MTSIVIHLFDKGVSKGHTKTVTITILVSTPFAWAS